MHECIDAFFSGDVHRAIEINAGLLASYSFEGSDEWPNPLPTKAVLRAMGVDVGQCRLPMGPADADLDARAAALVETLGLVRG